jgi:hypothetical protein
VRSAFCCLSFLSQAFSSRTLLLLAPLPLLLLAPLPLLLLAPLPLLLLAPQSLLLLAPLPLLLLAPLPLLLPPLPLLLLPPLPLLLLAPQPLLFLPPLPLLLAPPLHLHVRDRLERPASHEQLEERSLCGRRVGRLAPLHEALEPGPLVVSELQRRRLRRLDDAEPGRLLIRGRERGEGLAYNARAGDDPFSLDIPRLERHRIGPAQRRAHVREHLSGSSLVPCDAEFLERLALDGSSLAASPQRVELRQLEPPGLHQRRSHPLPREPGGGLDHPPVAEANRRFAPLGAAPKGPGRAVHPRAVQRLCHLRSAHSAVKPTPEPAGAPRTRRCPRPSRGSANVAPRAWEC